MIWGIRLTKWCWYERNYCVFSRKLCCIEVAWPQASLRQWPLNLSLHNGRACLLSQKRPLERNMLLSPMLSIAGLGTLLLVHAPWISAITHTILKQKEIITFFQVFIQTCFIAYSITKSTKTKAPDMTPCVTPHEPPKFRCSVDL